MCCFAQDVSPWIDSTEIIKLLFHQIVNLNSVLPPDVPDVQSSTSASILIHAYIQRQSNDHLFSEACWKSHQIRLFEGCIHPHVPEIVPAGCHEDKVLSVGCRSDCYGIDWGSEPLQPHFNVSPASISLSRLQSAVTVHSDTVGIPQCLNAT